MSQDAVIAVDASILGRIMSGVGVYVENVLRYLDMPGVDFHLFSDVPLEPIRIPGRECEVVPLPFTSQVPGHNLLGPFWTHYLLPRAIKRQGIPLLWSPYFHVPLGFKGPTLATIHDTNPIDVKAKSHPPLWKAYFLRMLARSAHRAAHIIVPSQRIADALGTLYGTPADRITVIYHGVSEAFSAPSEPQKAEKLRADLGLDGPFLLFVGSLGDRKNAITLVRAYSQLPRELQQAYKLLIVGPGGSDEGMIRDLIREAHLEDRVLLTGYVDYSVVPELYKMAKVFALPSLCESFGLPIVEAMAAGTPVLTSNTTSIPEVAGDAAILLPPTDVEAWARELQRVLTDEATHADLRQRGYERAKRFSWPESARQHAEIFRRFV